MNNELNLEIVKDKKVEILFGLSLIGVSFMTIDDICNMNVIIYMVILLIIGYLSLNESVNYDIIYFVKLLLCLFVAYILFGNNIEYLENIIVKGIFMVVGLYIIYEYMYGNKKKKILKSNVSLKGGKKMKCDVESIDNDINLYKFYYKGEILDLTNIYLFLKEELKKDSMDKNELKSYYLGVEAINHFKDMKKTLKTGNLSILLDNLKSKEYKSNLKYGISEAATFNDQDIMILLKELRKRNSVVGNVCFNGISI